MMVFVPRTAMPPSARPARPTGERPLLPPVRVWVTATSLLAAIALVRAGLLEPVVGAIVDHAVRNIITLILGFFSLLSVVVWFLRESGHSASLKRVVGYGLLLMIAAAAALLRIERVSGDLVPELRPRWMPSRDRLLPAAKPVAAASVAAWEPTADDFPRFLGPEGSAAIDRPEIDSDWSTRPPREVWRTPIGAGWSGFAICGDHAVTLEQRGDQELVTCRSVVDGSLEWAVGERGRHETVLGGAGPRSTPTIRDGIVYATGATGWLHAIDGATGRVVWKQNIVKDLGLDPEAHAAAVTWGRAGSPLVTDSLVIVPGGGPVLRPGEGNSAMSLVGYDRADGSRRWMAGRDQISYVTPQLVTVGDREVVLTANESNVTAYDPASGEELWGFDWPGHSNSDATCSQPHVLAGDRIFISKGYGIGAGVFAVDESNPIAVIVRPIWRQAGLLKTKFTNVAIHDGHAYGLSDGILECVRLEDGKRRWKGGRYGQGQVLRVGGLLIVQAEDGDVVLVACQPDKREELARLPALSGQTWNNPALSGDRLLVRNAEEAACFIVPLATAEAAEAEDASDP